MHKKADPGKRHKMLKRVLVTGGAGYIGSHTSLLLLESNYEVVVIDNLSNSSPTSIKHIENISKRGIKFIQGDIQDTELVAKTLEDQSIESVIHFAGLKAVGESGKEPLTYYKNNVCGTISLCEAMQDRKVKNLVFSSSATVYAPSNSALLEDHPCSPNNPYGRTKFFIEQILQDIYNADPEWNIAILRYFNPIGAHPSGLIGEAPKGPPNNLMPYIAQVAAGRKPYLQILGQDYPTKDGTGVRDYIHVMDLAQGHIQALNWLQSGYGLDIFNLGTGKGYSVLELCNAFSNACGKPIPYKIVERREGDTACSYASTSKARNHLHWHARKSLEEACTDTWNWQSRNPFGYE